MRVFTPGGIFDESSMPVASSAGADDSEDLFPHYTRIMAERAAAAADGSPYAVKGKSKGMDGKDKNAGNGSIFWPKPPMGPPPAVVAAQAAAPSSGDIDDVGMVRTRYGQMCKKQQEHGEQLEMQQLTIDQHAQKLERQQGVMLLQKERIEEQAHIIDQHEHRLGQQERKLAWLLGKLDRLLILPSDGEQP
jgi:hypothetical protein